MSQQMFSIYQTVEGETTLLYEVYDEQQAEDYVDRMNSHLSDAGVPSWVSCYFYE